MWKKYSFVPVYDTPVSVCIESATVAPSPILNQIGWAVSVPVPTLVVRSPSE